jgi:quercetin dioxygenase-like cupin family protein
MPVDYRVERWAEEFGPDSSTLRSRMEQDGYSVFEWSDRPGTEYGPHSHYEDQSHSILSGTLELSVKDAGVFILKAGDRDFMPAGTFHSARVISDEPAVYLIGSKH